MFSFSKKKLISLFGVVLFVLGAGYTILLKTKVDENGPDDEEQAVILAAALKIQHVWEKGQVEKEKNCYEYFPNGKMEKEFLKCNPHTLLCLFENIPLNVEIEGKSYSVDIDFPKNNNSKYKIVSRSQNNKGRLPEFALELSLRFENLSETIWLSDQCKMIKLPQRVYGLGPFRKSKDFSWDNFEKSIYIDRHLVTNRDIIEWYQQTSHRKRKLFEKKYSVERYFEPALELNLEEMEKYCAFRGKRLLEAHYLDAASFYVDKADPKKRKTVFRGPYPWTKKSKKAVLKEIKKTGKVDGLCYFLPSLECKDKLTGVEIFTSSPSWSGLFQTLGGYPEVVRNPHFPRRNLKFSSFLLPFNNSWNELGKRAFWDGLGHLSGHFSFGIRGIKEIDLPDSIPVGFRCMKEVL